MCGVRSMRVSDTLLRGVKSVCFFRSSFLDRRVSAVCLQFVESSDLLSTSSPLLPLAALSLLWRPHELPVGRLGAVGPLWAQH